MGAIAKFLLGAARVVARILDRSFREWSEWAAREPAAAAHELELIASVLEGRARARRKPDGWLGRRDRSIAASLRAHATKLRSVRGSGNPQLLIDACAVKPGTMSTPPASSEVRSLP